MENTIVFERGDHLYLVGSVAPIKPGDSEIQEFAFADALKTNAPNENIMWLRGQYVEGDRANKNGQLWSSDELSIKSLTPRLMPVTIMHDPRTAVGLIADTKLLTPEASNVPRSRIETALAIWAHRFPETAEECLHNYKQGTLMQSMECSIGHYECTECGKGYVKLPENAERANWCDHLKAQSANGVPVRRLRDVNFTGSGLIFGTRQGATGALDTAHLEVFQAEVAEFHERAVKDRKIRRTSHMDTFEIKRSEYDELKAAAAKVAELASKIETLTAEVAKVTELEKDLEKAEIALKDSEDKRAKAETSAKELEEAALAAKLSTDRLGALGTGFTAKLPETTKTRLTDQAATLSDEDWTARLDELSELVGVKHDEGATAPEAGSTTTDETSRTALGGSSQDAAPSRADVSTVLGGLFTQVRPRKPAEK